MVDQQPSPARAFFLAHRDLFQYERFVGNQDPFPHDHEDGEAAKSFLEKYCEIDHAQPEAAPLSKLHFSLLHPPAPRYLNTNPASSTTTSSPAFVALQSTASILKNFNDPPRESICSQVFASSPHTMNYHTQQQPGPLPTAYKTAPPQEYPSPARVSATTIKANTSDQFQPLQQQRSPIRFSIESKHKPFRLPKLAELLIDPETRAAATAHKTWDEAHKIEVLVGSKCVGRVSAASRNIPNSVRLRLRASANVSVRRERLYDLLRQEYDMMNKHCTQ